MSPDSGLIPPPNSGSDFVIEFLPVTIEGEPRCLKHEALAWEEEEDLPGFDLAPSDRRYVEARLEERPR